MSNTTTNLTNINLLTKAQYDAIQSPATDELWAVDIADNSEFQSKLMVPDLTAGITFVAGTMQESGWVYVRLNNNKNLTITANGEERYYGSTDPSTMYMQLFTDWFPVFKGETIEISGSYLSLIFYPMKGA